MPSERGKNPDPVPNPGGLRAALGRCGGITLAATKQLCDTGPRGTSREGAFSVEDGLRAEEDSKSKSFMKSKKEVQRDHKGEHA